MFFILFAFIVSFLGASSSLRAEDEDNPNLDILTCTLLHSANWLWSDVAKISEWHEYGEEHILGKTSFPYDCARNKIGIAEKIKLKVVGKDELIGSDPKWKIIEGEEWGELLQDRGREVILGAKVIPNSEEKPREIQVMVVVGKFYRITTIIVLEPKGINSRHAGNATQDAKDVANNEKEINIHDQLRDDLTPPHPKIPIEYPYGAGAWSLLDLIFGPTEVNFGGDHDGGVFVKETDMGSPPKEGTFTPLVDSVFKKNQHNPNPSGEDPYHRIDRASHLTDYIMFYASPVTALKTGQHTCDWDCNFDWNAVYHWEEGVDFKRTTQHFDMSVINVYWLDDYSNGTRSSPIRETAESFSDGVVVHAPCSATTTITKFNSSVTRKSRETTQTRTGNWEP